MTASFALRARRSVRRAIAVNRSSTVVRPAFATVRRPAAAGLRSALAVTVSLPAASATIWTLGPRARFALVLRDSYAWSLDRLESWIADAGRALLLGDRS